MLFFSHVRVSACAWSTLFIAANLGRPMDDVWICLIYTTCILRFVRAAFLPSILKWLLEHVNVACLPLNLPALVFCGRWWDRNTRYVYHEYVYHSERRTLSFSQVHTYKVLTRTHERTHCHKYKTVISM